MSDFIDYDLGPRAVAEDTCEMSQEEWEHCQEELARDLAGLGPCDDGLTPQQRAVLMGFDVPPF